MGGTSSTRKITVVNDETAGVIKISDSVVKRLRGEAEQATSRKPGLSESERTVSTSTPTPDSSVVRRSNPTAPSTRTSAPYEALRLNHEREEDIRSLEAHWKGKLTVAEEQNVAIQKRMAGEFAAAVDEVGKLFPTQTCEAICSEKQQKVQQCYETNPKTSLKCSKEVRDFSDCVQQARLGTLIRG